MATLILAFTSKGDHLHFTSFMYKIVLKIFHDCILNQLHIVHI
jgi:hypothetical protein